MLQKVLAKWSGMGAVLGSPRAGYLVLALYLLIGLLIVGDYGISIDEPAERITSLVHYKYVMSEVLQAPESAAIKEFFDEIPDYSTYDDNYYGTALHFPLVVLEHLKGFQMSTPKIYLVRHLYNFLNYVCGAFCFFQILRRRYEGSPIALLGLLMYILYPRFFAEAFYNNKDIMFLSWYVISAYCGITYLEKPGWRRMIVFAAAAAICTNTRVLGVSLVALVFLYQLRTAWKKKEIWLLLLSYFGCYVAVTPYTWANPIKNSLNTFFFFLFDAGWSGTHFYLGKLISKEVPWHYLPVWMGITIPVLYLILFFIGAAAVVIAAARYFRVHRKEKAEGNSAAGRETAVILYDTFFWLLFFLSFLGYIGLNIKMYTGWRHAYFIFGPFLYLAIRGLYAVYSFCTGIRMPGKRRLAVLVFGCFSGSYLLILGLWSVRNHPYQYVYFNPLIRPYAEDNFEIDYWRVSSANTAKKILEMDDSPHITVAYRPFSQAYLILEGEERLSLTDQDFAPDYIVVSSRGDIAERRNIAGYQKVYSKLVDGYEVGSLYRYLIEKEDFDGAANRRIMSISAGNSDNFDNNIEALNDGFPDTGWSVPVSRSEAGCVVIEFTGPVDYNLLRCNAEKTGEYPVQLEIMTSMDGVNWEAVEMIYGNKVDHLFAPCEYKYLRLSTYETIEDNLWSITEISFGRKTGVLPEPLLRRFY